jgi:hypothetical protein
VLSSLACNINARSCPFHSDRELVLVAMFLIVSECKICLRWGNDGQEKVHRLHIAVLNSGQKSCTIC